jgi:hypothetical protein
MSSPMPMAQLASICRRARPAALPQATTSAVRGATEGDIGASPPAFGDIAAKWADATEELSYFHLKDFGSERRELPG